MTTSYTSAAAARRAAAEKAALHPPAVGLQRGAAEVLLTPHQVCHLTGLTYRQLDYGTRTGNYACSVPAGGSGSRRYYTLADLVAVAKSVAVLQLAEHIESLAYQPPLQPLRACTLDGEPTE